MRHHLAILYPQYLDLICACVKTVECRLTQRRVPPYGLVAPGDLLWLKESCGPVRAVAEAGRVRTLENLDRTQLAAIRDQLNHRIHAAPDFWHTRRDAVYATLIWLRDVQPVAPFRIVKADRRAWVVLDGPLAPDQIIPAMP